MTAICSVCGAAHDGKRSSAICPACIQVKRFDTVGARTRTCCLCRGDYSPAGSAQKYCTDCIPRVAAQLSEDPTVIRVVQMYLRGSSMTSISQATGVSNQKVRRILIHYGLFTNETIRQVQKLHDDGLDLDEIAAKLGITRNAVSSMLPYDRGAYNLKNPTPGAAILRHWRAKKED